MANPLRSLFPWRNLLFFLAAITLPFVYGWTQDGGVEFQGVLVNIVDANAYLSKMYQGYQGEWLARFLHTPQPGEGSLIYVYYIFLGHLSRIFSLPLVLVFHLARVFGAIFMFYRLYHFYLVILPNARLVSYSMFLALFGSGFGWIAAARGLFTADFWVAEAYPFLSSMVNPHFVLALGLLVWLSTPQQKQVEKNGTEKWIEGGVYFWGGLFLANLSPFAAILGFVNLGVCCLWDLNRTGFFQMSLLEWQKEISRSPYFARVFGAGIGITLSGLYLIHIFKTIPVFSAWNAQNITVSPPLWDLAISFSPALILALGGIFVSLRRNRAIPPVLLVWVLLTLLFVFLPFQLQRRFLIGFFVPLVALGVIWIAEKFKKPKNQTRILFIAIIISMPTNGIVLLSTFQAMGQRVDQLYIQTAEKEAFQWLDEVAPVNSLVIAGPETGLLIPRYTGLRVVYGHPFESMDADNAKNALEKYYQGRLPLYDLISSWNSDALPVYLWLGPREMGLLQSPDLTGTTLVYENAQVKIYMYMP